MSFFVVLKAQNVAVSQTELDLGVGTVWVLFYHGLVFCCLKSTNGQTLSLASYYIIEYASFMLLEITSTFSLALISISVVHKAVSGACLEAAVA